MKAEGNPYRKYYANFPKGVGVNCSNCVGAYDEGYEAGIKEVVGWIDKPCPHTSGLEEQQMRAMDCFKCWEDAKKEWGITASEEAQNPR